jgi:superfamily II DNA/RNA helicase
VLGPSEYTLAHFAPRGETCLQTTFESLGLAADLVHTLTEQGFVEPTSLQQEAVPAILAGRDLLGLAGDGAGRTLAYGLPALQSMHDRPRTTDSRGPRALLLLPTRELAARTEEGLRLSAQRLGLTAVLIQGGVDYTAQVELLARGVDLVVATTGRLLDHVAKGTMDLSAVGIFVVDAADRLTDVRFQRDIHRLLPALPAERQTLLFATTVSDEIRAFAADLLREPVVVELSTVGSAAMSRPARVDPRPRRGQPKPDTASAGQQWQDRPPPGNTRNDDVDRRPPPRDRQPLSHESSLFPSSGPVFGYGDANRGRRTRPGPRRRGES